MHSRFRTRIGFLLSLWLGWIAVATSAGSAFTYQGRLVDGGVPASGGYELTFRLFDSLDAGTQVGADLVVSPVDVTAGLFTVELDFGLVPFDGSDRWLEILARPVGDVGDPELLSPRQPVTAVPYALRALSVVGGGDASALVTGTLPDVRLSSNIPRKVDLLTLSNALTARIDALEAQLATVIGAVNTISNQAKPLPPAGLTVVSRDPADAGLISGGWVRFSSVAEPGWRNGTASGAPGARTGHSAVWTGDAWLIWGGTPGGADVLATGFGYSPGPDQWAPLSPIEAPSARRGHSAVWTGSRMLVWGGFGGGYLGDGARFTPSPSDWSPMTGTDAPEGRLGQAAAWTGSRMAIWGGQNGGGLRSDGALYDPVGDGWSALPGAGAPEARTGATMVWTGTELILWGGTGQSGQLGTGARLPLAGGATPGAWSGLPGGNAPTPRQGHTAVWTGDRMLVWGGSAGGVPVGTGAAYDPIANTWEALPTGGAPAARSGHVAVWTGSEMLIFGGEAGGVALATGAAYDPAAGTWRVLSTRGTPLARTVAVAGWTGQEMLIFGGSTGGTPVGTLQRLDPEPTWYFYRKP